MDHADDRQTAKTNRQRLAAVERPAILVEIDRKADAVRSNMARLRELRLAKEAELERTAAADDAPVAAVKGKRKKSPR